MILRRTLPLLAAGAALAAPLAAQPVTVSTVPMGGMVVEVPAGQSFLSVPFQSSVSHQGVISSVAGNYLELPGISALSDASYIHVLDGDAAGQVLTILSQVGDLLEVNGVPLGLVSGATVAVRSHSSVAALGQLFSADEGDLIQIYNFDGSQLSGEFFPGFGWYSESQDDFIDDLIIYPGESILISVSSPRSILLSGSVSTHPVVFPYAQGGASLIGTLSPVSSATISELFGGASSGDVVTLYHNVGGFLQSFASLEFFEGFGFYDEVADDFADETSVVAGSGVFFNPSSNGSVVFPPAYQSQQ